MRYGGQLDHRMVAAIPARSTANALFRGVDAGQAAKSNALAIQGQEVDNKIFATQRLSQAVLGAQDPAAAYPVIMGQAREMGLDVDGMPDQWGPEAEAAMMIVANATPEELVEFEALNLGGGGVAVFDPKTGNVRTAIDPREESAKPPSGYTFDGQGGLQFIPGGPADPAVKAAGRGPGMALEVGPDGTVRFGEAGLENARSTNNALEAKAIGQQDLVANFRWMEDSIFNAPDSLGALTLNGQALMAIDNWSDWLGFENATTPEQKARVDAMNNFRTGAFDVMNEYIRSITGAAMTNSEAERILKGVPNPQSDGPRAFMTKLNTVRDRAEAALARSHILRSQGVFTDVEDAATRMPLGRVEQMMNQREAELRAMVDKGELTKQEAAIAFGQEFGL